MHKLCLSCRTIYAFLSFLRTETNTWIVLLNNYRVICYCDCPYMYLLSMCSVCSHRAELVDYMIDHGAWHEACDVDGNTPLLWAASLGHVDCAKVLLRRAAHGLATNAANLTPLAIAVAQNHVDMVQTLLENGLSPNDLPSTTLHACMHPSVLSRRLKSSNGNLAEHALRIRM